MVQAALSCSRSRTSVTHCDLAQSTAGLTPGGPRCRVDQDWGSRSSSTTSPGRYLRQGRPEWGEAVQWLQAVSLGLVSGVALAARC